MKIFQLRAAALAIAAIVPALACRPAMALGECSRFGKPSYTAQRTVSIGGQTFVAKVAATPQAEREDLSSNGRSEVRIATAAKLVTYNLDSKTGVSQSLPKPPRPPKENVRVGIQDRDGLKVITIELKDDKGSWQQIARTTCRADGVLLEKEFTVPGPGGGAPVVGHMTQSVLSIGPVDAGMFKVPPDIKLNR